MHKKFDQHMKCPSSMIGKSTHQSLRLKGTIMLFFLLIVIPDTDEFME
jgi:hypothetical protein